MKQSNIRVCVRVKPSGGSEDILIDQRQNTIEVKSGESGEKEQEDKYDSFLSNKKPNMTFSYHKILHHSSQTEVYDYTSKDIVTDFVEGINGAIMSYGQTSSGKTFSVIGDTSNHEFRGITPRAIAQLFVEIENRPEIEFKVSCSFVEIYNEKIFDLLSSFESSTSRSDYSIVEDAAGRGTYVRGVNEINTDSEESTLNILFSGDLNRTTAEHRLNRKSNRSHSIFTIFLQQKLKSGSSSVLKLSKLNIVDLAGSERLKKTLQLADSSKVVSPQEELIQRESMFINQSLSYLEQCVVALAKQNQSYVPYRQSKLTNLLKDSMGGNGNTVVIACILGERVHMEETISTLRLAQRMTRVQNKTFSVEVVDTEKLVTQQQQQIRLLKQELLMRDAIIERSGVNYNPFSDQEKMKLRQQIEEFIQAPDVCDDCPLLQFDSLRTVVEMIKQFKSIIKEARVGGAAIATSGDNSRLNSQMPSRPATSMMGTMKDGIDEGDGVGEVQTFGSMSIGVAPSNSRPGQMDQPSPHRDARQYLSTKDHSMMENNQKTATARRKSLSPGKVSDSDSPNSRSSSPKRLTSATRRTESSQIAPENVLGDKETAYNYFKLNQGRNLANKLKEDSNGLREVRERLRRVTNSVNDAKEEIDKLRKEIDCMKVARVDNLRSRGVSNDEIDCILDEDEYKLMKKEKDVKKSYKIAFEDYKRLSDQMHAIKSARDGARVELVEEFNKWFEHESRLQEKRSQLEGIGDDNNEDIEQMDDQEAFDQIEIMRTIQKDPASLAFFRAQKNQRANLKQHGKVIQRARREKRQI